MRVLSVESAHLFFGRYQQETADKHLFYECDFPCHPLIFNLGWPMLVCAVALPATLTTGAYKQTKWSLQKVQPPSHSLH